MKNNLSDLNNHLFTMLEELDDDDLEKDSELLEKKIEKSKGNKFCFFSDSQSCKCTDSGNKNNGELWPCK